MATVTDVTQLELTLHIIMITVAAITFVLMSLALSNLSVGTFKKTATLFLIALAFSTIRWAGGSLTALNVPIMNIFAVQLAWWLSGIIAAIFAAMAAYQLMQFSNTIGFKKKIN